MEKITRHLVESYYAAFNAGDRAAFLALLTDDVAHDINQGACEIGKDAFDHFLDHMVDCYEEQIEDIVILTEPSGIRAAAEFSVHGRYLKTEAGLPAAQGQRYVLPAGAFFTIRDGKISRISNYYNLSEWVRQVSI